MEVNLFSNRVDKFSRAGLVVRENEGIAEYVASRFTCIWMKWKEGVLCDKSIPLKVIEKFYKIVSRPVRMC